MALTMEEKELLRKEYAKAKWRKPKDVEYAVTRTSGYTEIGDCIVPFDKPSIETRFCFGEHGYDYDEVGDYCQRMSKSEDFFIRKNMEEFDRIDKCIDKARRGHLAAWLCHNGDGSDIGYVTFTRLTYDGWEEPRGKDPLKLTDEGLDAYAALIDGERAKFLKRLHTYLKRYGMSKCDFWTYWADR